jgi:23S rRNA (cytosine1962-C5)-methyltransferase
VYQRLAELTGLLGEALGPPTSLDRPGRAGPDWRIVIRADRSIQNYEGFRIEEAANRGAPGSVTIREHGLRYRVDPTSGHKTGFFCDQRENRLRLARLCRGARVLDLCCYSGGFGLCARKLGAAAEVTSVDLDEAAVALARENANLNQARIDLVQADAFIYLRQMLELRRQYDVVVLDPPKLAPTRDSREEALRKYHDLNALGMQVVPPGGILLTCSCSGLISPDVFRETVCAAARRAGRTLQLFDQSGAAPDHPVRMNCPESAYLKALWFRVL